MTDKTRPTDMDTDEKLRVIARRIGEFFLPDAPVDVPSMIFVAGLQVLGRPEAGLSRDDKLAVMHVGTCALLEPYGYYRMTGRDGDGWPQYELLRPVDERASSEGELLKEALAGYFADLL